MNRLLDAKIAARQQAMEDSGLLRRRVRLSTQIDASAVAGDSPIFIQDGKRFINFSSNDYLGLSAAPQLAQALYQGAQIFGVGSGASPLVTGYSDAHFALEQHLCELTGHEAALLFSSGFSANSALMKTLFDKHDLVIADKLVHASIIDGLKDSDATLKRFIHNDVDSATRLMANSCCNVSALITESVFSMDGDIAPLSRLSALCREHGAWFIVDDAHGFGVIGGQGLGASQLADIDAQVITFGKALGCQGAAILGPQRTIDFLVSHAREYVYSTALSPANAHLALAACHLLQSEPERLEQLQQNIRHFKQLCHENQLPLLPSDTAIQPLIIGDSHTTMQISDALRAQGFWLGAIRPPTVPLGSARLRLTLTARHSQADIERCVMALAQVFHQFKLIGGGVSEDASQSDTQG